LSGLFFKFKQIGGGFLFGKIAIQNLYNHIVIHSHYPKLPIEFGEFDIKILYQFTDFYTFDFFGK
jgi:hypothetical protein